MESLRKVIEEIKATLIPQHMVTNQLLTNPEYSYRDALMSNQNPASTSPANFHEAKLQNRININAHQILIEIQTDNENPIKDDNPTDSRTTGKLKTTANHWLENRDGDNPPPSDTSIWAITLCCNRKLLIEANTTAAASWIKLNTNCILSPLIGHPIKVLDRQYLVVA